MDDINYTSSGLALESEYSINFFTVRNIQISSQNFIMNNINTSTPNKASIITSIPVNSNMNGIISYKNMITQNLKVSQVR